MDVNFSRQEKHREPELPLQIPGIGHDHGSFTASEPSVKEIVFNATYVVVEFRHWRGVAYIWRLMVESALIVARYGRLGRED